MRGDLNLDEAFQAFTERVLSLAVVPENDEHKAPTVAGKGYHDSGSGGGDDSLDPTSGAAGVTKKERRGAPAAAKRTVVVDSAEKDKPSGALPSARGSVAHGGDNEDATPRSRESGDISISSVDGKDVPAEKGPMFSVGHVAAITQFVARGFYRNFALYRMCFEEEPRFCSESRHVQVETPLPPPPLYEAAPVLA